MIGAICAVVGFTFGGIVGVFVGVYQERKRSRPDVKPRSFGGIN